MADVARSHHEVDPRRAFEDPLPFLLRDAAADPDGQFAVLLALQFTEPAELGQHLLLRLVADRAGIEQDQVGGGLVVHARVAAQLQSAAQTLAVEIIHLTAPRFDEEGLGHRLLRNRYFNAANASRASANSFLASSSCFFV